MSKPHRMFSDVDPSEVKLLPEAEANPKWVSHFMYEAVVEKLRSAPEGMAVQFPRGNRTESSIHSGIKNLARKLNMGVRIRITDTVVYVLRKRQPTTMKKAS